MPTRVPGIVVIFNDDDNDNATHQDAPSEEVTVSAAVYRYVDGASPTTSTLYTVSDISTLPPPLAPGVDRRRVYELIHETQPDSVPGAATMPPNQEFGLVMLSMSADHPEPPALRKWHVDMFPMLRAVPGWVRTRGADLVEGAPGVPVRLALHNFATDDSLTTDEFERYINDPRRTAIASQCTKLERRIARLVRHLDVPARV